MSLQTSKISATQRHTQKAGAGTPSDRFDRKARKESSSPAIFGFVVKHGRFPSLSTWWLSTSPFQKGVASLAGRE